MLNEPQKHPYRFGSFQLDPSQRVLLRDGVEVTLTPKAFLMLLMLVERAGQVVDKEELMQRLWPDSFVEENNLTVHKSALAKALGEGYIQTVPKRGYRFAMPVKQLESSIEAATPDERVADLESAKQPRQQDLRTTQKRLIATGALILICVAVLMFAWRRAATMNEMVKGARVQVHSPVDEAEIKRVVKESQMFEFLTLDTDPAVADESLLPKYYVSGEQGGKEIQSVKTSIEKLRGKGWHYGKDSRVEIFDFRYVRVFSPRDYAEAGTSERWYLPMRRADESRVEDRNVYYGVYDIDYSLRKINGAWLIEEASTPRSQK